LALVSLDVKYSEVI